MIQKSYENSEYGKLYLIPTPIGNLDDITLRAIKTLEMVDIVYAEDTRETLNLLKYLKINKKVEPCHKYTEMKHKDKIVQILKSGKNIGYVTDRGTPLISDPGNVIVDESIKQNITVIALPGPNALLPAINMSGLSNERFLFYGFLNSKQSLAKKELIDLKDIKQTIISILKNDLDSDENDIEKLLEEAREKVSFEVDKSTVLELFIKEGNKVKNGKTNN